MGTDLKLTGRRVWLRPMTVNDADDVVRWRNEPCVAEQMFALPPRSREDHLSWFEKMEAGDDRQEFIVMRSLHEAEPQAIGTIGLSQINRRHERAEYGILIGEASARGTGLAREASELILDYAFRALQINKIFLHVFANNNTAIKLYERLGFAREGVLRLHARQNEMLRDVMVMGILRNEWINFKDGVHS